MSNIAHQTRLPDATADYKPLQDIASLAFGAAPIFDGRLVISMIQANPLNAQDVEAELALAGFERDPAVPTLYRSRGIALSKAVRAIRLAGPTEILHPSGEPQRVTEGWIVQRLDDPSDIFLVPQHEFVSHYIPRTG